MPPSAADPVQDVAGPRPDVADSAVTPARPSTPPPPPSAAPVDPRTPEPPQASIADPRAQRAPHTPSGPSTYKHPASVYLSSPIRRAKHGSLAAGTMTPGRPSLKHGRAAAPFSPFRARPASSTSSAPDSGLVDLGNPASMGSLPLQTVMMTAQQAAQITDLDVAKDALVRALQESEQFRKAAHHFRTLAAHHAFQHRILEIERTETEQRYGVEVNIQQKEIEKLLVDIMGFDRSMDSEQVRRRLKRTKHRLRELEEVLVARDTRIAELQSVLAQFARFPYADAGYMPMQVDPPLPAAPPLPASAPGPESPRNAGAGSSDARADAPGASPVAEKPRPPPINTQLPSSPAGSEPLSALEVLASQVLSSGIQPHSGLVPPGAVPGEAAAPSTAPAYGSSSPYSPFAAPFSPFAMPPQLTRPAPTSVPQFGSPEKRRRPSSSSTISAMSEEDTLEEVHE